MSFFCCLPCSNSRDSEQSVLLDIQEERESTPSPEPKIAPIPESIRARIPQGLDLIKATPHSLCDEIAAAQKSGQPFEVRRAGGYTWVYIDPHTKSGDGIGTLSGDILRLILTFLQPRDMYNLRMTAKKFEGLSREEAVYKLFIEKCYPGFSLKNLNKKTYQAIWMQLRKHEIPEIPFVKMDPGSKKMHDLYHQFLESPYPLHLIDSKTWLAKRLSLRDGKIVYPPCIANNKLFPPAFSFESYQSSLPPKMVDNLEQFPPNPSYFSYASRTQLHTIEQTPYEGTYTIWDIRDEKNIKVLQKFFMDSRNFPLLIYPEILTRAARSAQIAREMIPQQLIKTKFLLFPYEDRKGTAVVTYIDDGKICKFTERGSEQLIDLGKKIPFGNFCFPLKSDSQLCLFYRDEQSALFILHFGENGKVLGHHPVEALDQIKPESAFFFDSKLQMCILWKESNLYIVNMEGKCQSIIHTRSNIKAAYFLRDNSIAVFTDSFVLEGIDQELMRPVDPRLDIYSPNGTLLFKKTCEKVAAAMLSPPYTVFEGEYEPFHFAGYPLLLEEES